MNSNTLSSFGSMIEELIKKLKQEFFEKAPYDKTYKGKITEVVNPNKYKVLINGNVYTASSSTACEVGELVWICVPRGNLKEAFVIGKTR